jgi:hypothetical protein
MYEREFIGKVRRKEYMGNDTKQTFPHLVSPDAGWLVSKYVGRQVGG